MKNKKYFACAAVAAALFINIPQISAEEVETFGADFEDEDDSEVVPFQEENLGDTLIFNNPTQNKPVEDTPEIIPAEDISEVPPVENIENKNFPPVENNFESEEPALIIDNRQNNERERILPPSRVTEMQQEKEKQKKMKTQKQRFIKLAVDDTYTYYLDKQSVSWQRIPYSASEYMLDVWIRMIEIEQDTSDLPDDLASYVNDKSSGEVAVAEEKGILFAPVDIDVLQHKKYFLEHYYLRPKTKQIQFLCELEVVGHPQNTVSERAYDYKNWENLIPGSIESIIYNMTMKEVGKSGSSDSGHMSFADYLEEYARISIR